MTEETESQSIIKLLFGSPVNTILTVFIAFLVYKLIKRRSQTKSRDESEGDVFKLPEPLPKHDMTLEELRKYDGRGPDKRICIAILGNVFDCTKGYKFYGVGGPYSPFAGHDATRALAQFDVEAIKDDWDDVSDLTPSQMSSVKEWMEQFSERYDLIGRLVKDKSEIIDDIETIQDNDDNKDDNNKEDKQVVN